MHVAWTGRTLNENQVNPEHVARPGMLPYCLLQKVTMQRPPDFARMHKAFCFPAYCCWQPFNLLSSLNVCVPDGVLPSFQLPTLLDLLSDALTTVQLSRPGFGQVVGCGHVFKQRFVTRLLNLGEACVFAWTKTSNTVFIS